MMLSIFLNEALKCIFKIQQNGSVYIINLKGKSLLTYIIQWKTITSHNSNISTSYSTCKYFKTTSPESMSLINHFV